MVRHFVDGLDGLSNSVYVRSCSARFGFVTAPTKATLEMIRSNGAFSCPFYDVKNAIKMS